MSNIHDTAWLVKAMMHDESRTPDVVNAYYTLCIPFYREFLGAHWHTGFYGASGPISPADQLKMELHIARSAGIDGTCRVLDVGCGMGGPACHIARATGAKVHGLTPNSVQLQLAKDLASQQGLGADRVEFVQGFADALPFDDASFDVVLFFESACHFPDRAAFFKEAIRVLKPGGRLAGEDWIANEGLDNLTVQRYIRPIERTWAIPQLGTLQSYRTGMEDAGLRVLEHIDMRHEMALARGFIVEPSDQRTVQEEIATSQDPVRRLIMQSLLHLGDAVNASAFTLGRFLAVKPSDALLA